MEVYESQTISKRPLRKQRYLHFELLPSDEKLIEQLPPEQQKVLRSEGSYAKRAQEIGVAIGTIRSRLHRAREALSRLRASSEVPHNEVGSH